jgi:hypothetical protein
MPKLLPKRPAKPRVVFGPISRRDPPLNPKTVYCFNCHRGQPDEGRRGTCAYCGFSPLPSVSYGVGHVFYPRSKEDYHPLLYTATGRPRTMEETVRLTRLAHIQRQQNQ